MNHNRSMDLRIERADFADPRLTDFVRAYLDDASTAPDESRHALGHSALAGPDIRLWAVLYGDSIAAMGALTQLESGTCATTPGHAGRHESRWRPVRCLSPNPPAGCFGNSASSPADHRRHGDARSVHEVRGAETPAARQPLG
ncbi:hypothetical protein [Rhodococcus gannanensis]|uniref:Uncharacterized protein n=1 Tax=Rhodococcus gannanensis TaxID=1960308 RepID=A0ABW4P9N2_9NOCA